jgi:Uncharacterized protein related to plant photosystem II stability/assembly factor
MKIILAVFSISLAFATACRISALSSKNDKPGSVQGMQSNVVVLQRGSSLRLNESTTNQIKELELKEGTNLTAIHFLDDTNGWVGGKEKVFKTENGGNSWEAVNVESPSGASVKSIFFVSSAVGWIVLQKSSPLAIDYEVNHFWLKHTTDGGRTWQLQYEGKEAEAAALSFTDARNGWLAGIKFGGLHPFRYTYLLLHTTDSGANWVDASAGLKQFTAERKQVPPDQINDGIMGLTLEGAASLTLITGKSELFTTSNEGQTWRPSIALQNQSDQDGIRRFGNKENRKLWFLTSADSIEGVGGGLTVEQPDGSWTSFKLPGVYFTDAVFLAGQQFLACGYAVDEETGQSEKHGVVLYSPDEGRNWSVIYRSKKIKAINSLYVVNPTFAVGAGENGLLLRVKFGPIAGNE